MYSVSQEVYNGGAITTYTIKNDGDDSLVGHVTISNKRKAVRWDYYSESGAMLFRKFHHRQIESMRKAVLSHWSDNG